jgi:exodeoxyribonuclease VII large subunit
MAFYRKRLPSLRRNNIMSNTEKKYYSLLEITRSLESVIRKTYTKSYWIKAEIAKLNYYSHS